jgi:NADH dehydrogenase
VRIAVTGASGFVGRHLMRRGAGQGRELLGLVRPGSAPAPGCVEIPALDADAIAGHLLGAVAVVHLANIGVERGDGSYSAVNAGGTREVIEAARRAGVPRIVYLSGLGVSSWGRSRRATNRYFLSKLEAELALFTSEVEAVVLRPSFILGPGGELVAELAGELREGRVEMVGDGAYRMQPIGVDDAAEAILAAATRSGDWPLAFDLVGREPIRYRDFVSRVAARLGAPGYGVRRLPVEEAERQAAGPGYRGMGPEALDCLLCDEVGSAAPLEELLGRRLRPLDAAIDAARAPLG